ncbi:MAG TPA: Zn-dependent alcohol dehydrogenase [Chloroflexota bacterium]|nr:Zn-dependent alcohol dehydrogenase [Chloroflexota bacterium]
MKAAVLYAANTPLQVEELSVEDPKRGEVMVRVAAGGVCHSDLHVMNGDLGAPLPVVLGHEGAGIVEKVGEGVGDFAPGDHVLLLWRASCGHCPHCLRGRPALCEMGTGIRWSGRLTDGTSRFRRGNDEIRHFNGVSSFGELTVLPREGLVKIDPTIPLEKAAIVGCAVMTGVGAVVNTARVAPGESIAVIGCGGVGLNVVQGAALAGAEKIVAVDVLDNKLEYARQFGATHVVNAQEGDPIEAVKEITRGGADYVFEVIGNPKTMSQGYQMTRRGGTLIIVGVARTGSEVSFPAPSLMLDEKTVRGSLYGSCRPEFDVPRFLNLYRAGKLKLDELISREYPLAQINEAFAALAHGEVARSIIRFY